MKARSRHVWDAWRELRGQRLQHVQRQKDARGVRESRLLVKAPYPPHAIHARFMLDSHMQLGQNTLCVAGSVIKTCKPVWLCLSVMGAQSCQENFNMVCHAPVRPTLSNVKVDHRHAQQSTSKNVVHGMGGKYSIDGCWFIALLHTSSILVWSRFRGPSQCIA
jgi:hypothetical protein